MGVNIKDICPRKFIELSDLKGKVIVFDGQNTLYQFLSTIRDRQGNLLCDAEGNVTSHLIGLFSRVCALLNQSIKPVFVFDGRPPERKSAELERRKQVKLQAQEKYEQAVAEGDVVSARKFALRTSRLTKDMVEDAKLLLGFLGVPVVQAPSEGEAQACFMCKHRDCWAVSSQDYDSLLFGAPRLIQNLSVGKSPELVEVDEVLKVNGISQDGLIALAVLVGTDYNPGGVHGIGPKKALALVKDRDPESVFREVNYSEGLEVFELIKSIPVSKDYIIKFGGVQESALVDFLVGKRGFDEVRVRNTIKPLMQHSLNRFF